jgi:hypothetical protein
VPAGPLNFDRVTTKRPAAPQTELQVFSRPVTVRKLTRSVMEASLSGFRHAGHVRAPPLQALRHRANQLALDSLVVPVLWRECPQTPQEQ